MNGKNQDLFKQQNQDQFNFDFEFSYKRPAQKHAQNDAFSKVKISDMQLKTLIALFQLGEGDSAQIAEQLNVRQNDVSGRCSELFKKGLICVNERKPFNIVQWNSKKTKRTNFILTAAGKEIISDMTVKVAS